VAAIETAGLTKRYGPVTAVDDLSFAVRESAVTGFLGPNGAGKTTTLRMILALARPTAGSATVMGRPYKELEQPARTVGANLEVAGAHPGRKGRDHLRALAAMASLPSSRVDEVLRLGDPQVLILDEPANGLDPQGIRWLRDFLRSMAAEGRTVLVSSHVLAEVAQTVDDVVVIHRGKVVDQGPVSRLTAGGHVIVRSPRAEELRAALERAGLTASVDGDALLVSADDPARVGEIAYEAGVPLHELTTRATSLEEAFLALTTDAEPIA
jgi:ABC-2 type transport system ATP-binding protein